MSQPTPGVKKTYRRSNSRDAQQQHYIQGSTSLSVLLLPPFPSFLSLFVSYDLIYANSLLLSQLFFKETSPSFSPFTDVAKNVTMFLHFLLFYFLQTFCCSNMPCTSVMKRKPCYSKTFQKKSHSFIPFKYGETSRMFKQVIVTFSALASRYRESSWIPMVI